MNSGVRKLKSEDGQLFEVEENILFVSKYLKDLINLYPDPDNEVNINQVDGKNLSKIIEYLKHYEHSKPKEIPKPLPSSDLRNKNSKEKSFDFLTKISNTNQNNVYEEESPKKSRNINLPKINPIIGKNSFLSIVSKNENSPKNKSRSTRHLNINFSYNNRVIKNYSFINKYINREKIKISKVYDPKEKYRIFDNYTKKFAQTNNENKTDIIAIKRHVPKPIKGRDLAMKIKNYQDYRKKILRKFEELSC